MRQDPGLRLDDTTDGGVGYNAAVDSRYCSWVIVTE
jgi:hypothetical protein